MKKDFEWLDDTLIDRLFQPLADWMNDRMALGPNRAARGAIDLASLCWILAQLSDVADAVHRHDVRTCVFLGLAVILGLWAFSILRNVFQRADGANRAGAQAQANPLRPGMQLHRVICLFWMIGLTVKTIMEPTDFTALALLAVGVFGTGAVYIGACANHPPKRRETARDLALASGRF
jgi:hypothetical protein